MYFLHFFSQIFVPRDNTHSFPGSARKNASVPETEAPYRALHASAGSESSRSRKMRSEAVDMTDAETFSVCARIS